MSKTTGTNQRLVLAGAAVALLLALGLGVQMVVLPSQKPVAVAAAPALPPLGSVVRYQVPVSLGQPKKGPEDALVTIVEWCDFHSPKCVQAEPVLAAVMQKYPKDVRLAFRHFADPTSIAGLEEHEFSRMVFEQAGKFFELKDLFVKQPGVGTREDIARYAKQFGMEWSKVLQDLDQHNFAGAIVADHTFADMFNVKEIPAFFVNGRRLQGDASVAGFSQLIDDELTRTKQLLSSGVAKDKVYAELIKNGLWEKPSLTRN
jgi:protein-disulfide isomerase